MMMDSHKEYKYYAEWEMDIESLVDLDNIVNQDFFGFKVRPMTVPDVFEAGKMIPVTFQVDFEDIDEVIRFSETSYDLQYISDDVYLNFENFITEYEDVQ